MTPRALSLLKTAIAAKGEECILTATDTKTHRAIRFLYRMDLIDYSKPHRASSTSPTGKPGWFKLKGWDNAHA